MAAFVPGCQDTFQAYLDIYSAILLLLKVELPDDRGKRLTQIMVKHDR